MPTLYITLKITFLSKFYSKFAIFPVFVSPSFQDLQIFNDVNLLRDYLAINLQPDYPLLFGIQGKNLLELNRIKPKTVSWGYQRLETGTKILFFKKKWFELTNEESLDQDIRITIEEVLLSKAP